MKIIISNIVTLNMGDAAILMGEIKILKETFGPHTEFVIYDSQPDIAKKYYPDLNFRKMIYSKLPGIYKRIPYIRKLVPYLGMIWLCLGALALRTRLDAVARLFLSNAVYQDLCEYRSADLVVSTGGTILVENYDLKPRWFDFAVTLLLGKPLVLFTQSLGPFCKTMNRFFARMIFKRTDLIFLRDEKSKKHLNDIGIADSTIHVCADAAFAFAGNTALADDKWSNGKPQDRIRVAVSVREWQHFKTTNPEDGMRRYKHAIRDLCVHFVKHHNAQITFLSTCQGVPEYWTNDAEFAAEIIDLLPPDTRSRVELNDRFHSPQELLELLRGFDFVVSTRLHMGILSLCAGIPVLSIAYEFKTKELYKRLNIPEFSIDIEQIESQHLIETTNRFLESMREMRVPLFSAVHQEGRNAYQPVSLLRAGYAPALQRRPPDMPRSSYEPK